MAQGEAEQTHFSWMNPMSNPTPQHDENGELQALPHVRRAPGIRLQRAEIELLRAAFPGAATLFIEREFRSGYSGALVLMVSVDSGQAPVVVKLAHPLDLQREYSAYHEFVLQRSPQNTANLRGAPIVCADGTLALQIYTFAGGSTQQPSSSLEDYYRRNGGSATAAVLTRIFRVYGRHWWAINQPRKFVLAEEYDRLLPVHLLATVCEADRSVDAILEAGKVSAVDLRDLVAGTHLELRGFRVAGVENRGEHIKLSASPPAGEASASIRIRVVGSGIVAGGDEALSSVFVEVTATRMDLLRMPPALRCLRLLRRFPRSTCLAQQRRA